ncbi:uncharacterized protein [Physcomitrium patens]|uniref:Uncharacterized protein n=2 Tax=Physcomitrium patens TaxID=3218 RepID=A0A2K1IM85_PHYPA|nr:uncharacterized protein LOC112274642 [Physcomitrium patens]PNR30391.1 hypothetical protein PHYPA_026707 [Physcomitrium patens]|eukprot:XP_024360064.1 uncharacterized protein LOC112274642 [Physcomitrella patens]
MSAGCAMASVSLSSRVVPTVVEARPVHSSSRQAWSRVICGSGAFDFRQRLWAPFLSTSSSSFSSRKSTVHVAASSTEKIFKTTVEIDRLIDNLRSTEYHNMAQLVAENVLAFDAPFWLRLAARADLCTSDDDRGEYEELASQIMSIVERIVSKTKEKIESSTDVLKAIIKPLTEDDNEIVWPPRNEASLIEMRKEVEKRELENFLDESFLSEVSAQLRQAKEDKDKPGLVAILQKVLQLYAACLLSKRSYAMKDGVVDKAEELLEKVMDVDEDKWNDLLRNGFTYGGGEVPSEDFFKAVDRRIERTLMRTENGSYQQRVLAEYIREIEARAESLIAAFQSSPSSR